MNFSNNLSDFLIYSYFGIDPELCVDSDKIVDAVVNCARIDASRHVHSFGDNVNDSVKCIKCAVNKLRKTCSAKLEKEQFDSWHFDVYEKLKQKDQTITYGIAQKWINMTLRLSVLILALGVLISKFLVLCQDFGH